MTIPSTLLSKIPLHLRVRIKKFLPDPIKRSLASLVSKSLGREGETIDADGLKFWNSRDRVFARLLLEGVYEPDLTRAALTLVQPGDNVADVGANFGWYTVQLARTVGKDGSVRSFEPMPSAYERLVGNIGLNGFEDTVIVKNAAVGSTEGTVEMHSDDSDRETALSYVSTSSSGMTEMVRLDSEIDQATQIAFMKVDVEGFEGEVLAGAERILRGESPPWLQLELNEKALVRAATSRSEVLRLLDDIGYTLFEASVRGGGLQPASADASDVFARPPKGPFRDRYDPDQSKV